MEACPRGTGEQGARGETTIAACESGASSPPVLAELTADGKLVAAPEGWWPAKLAGGGIRLSETVEKARRNGARTVTPLANLWSVLVVALGCGPFVAVLRAAGVNLKRLPKIGASTSSNSCHPSPSDP